ncbi:hypothetical protein GGF46_003576 [Coemansia sp. RSA 552]|nr:hypothetical protein GGF46_003576 [Coemansia sp. RSA 552]
MFALAARAWQRVVPLQLRQLGTSGAAQAAVQKLERSRPPRSVTKYKKPFTERKQYLFGTYDTQFASNQGLLVVQHYNLSGAEMLDLRRRLKLEAGAGIMIVRAKMMKAVLRDTRYANLGALFTGPSALIYWPAGDTLEGMAKALEIVKKQRKVVVMGGKYEDILLNPGMVQGLVTMPSMDQLRSQLVGVVQTPAQKLAAILGRVPQSLVGVLAQRADGEGSDSKSS